MDKGKQRKGGMVTDNGMVYPAQNIKLVSLSQLKMDMAYQRPTDLKRVDRMRENFNPSRLGLVSIGRSIINGVEELRVDDGRHRCTMLIQLGATHVYAEVQNRTYEESAKFFADQYLDCVKSTSYQQHNSNREAKDALTLEVDEACENAGYYIRSKSTRANILTAKHIPALLAVCKLYDSKHLTKTLNFISEVWPENEDAVSVHFIVGVSEFLAQAEGYDYKALRSKLSNKRASALQGEYDNRILAIRKRPSVKDVVMRRTFANVVVDIYNSQRSEATMIKRLGD